MVLPIYMGVVFLVLLVVSAERLKLHSHIRKDPEEFLHHVVANTGLWTLVDIYGLAGWHPTILQWVAISGINALVIVLSWATLLENSFWYKWWGRPLFTRGKLLYNSASRVEFSKDKDVYYSIRTTGGWEVYRRRGYSDRRHVIFLLTSWPCELAAIWAVTPLFTFTSTLPHWPFLEGVDWHVWVLGVWALMIVVTRYFWVTDRPNRWGDTLWHKAYRWITRRAS